MEKMQCNLYIMRKNYLKKMHKRFIFCMYLCIDLFKGRRKEQ